MVETSDDDSVEDDEEEEEVTTGPGLIGDESKLEALVEQFEDEDALVEANRQGPDAAKETSEAARRLDDLYQSVMGVRILLQSVLTKAGELASGGDRSAATAAAKRVLEGFVDLEDRCFGTKRRRGLEWPEVVQAHYDRGPAWERTVESWRRRTTLGAATAKLTALDLGPFAAARGALGDRLRAQKKMHPNGDLEVYDDGPLYRAQLRDFVNARPRHSDAVYDMARKDLGRAPDATSSHKDRRASKGRKLRFEVHDKLRNFMVPVPGPIPNVDVDLVLRSLFQYGRVVEEDEPAVPTEASSFAAPAEAEAEAEASSFATPAMGSSFAMPAMGAFRLFA